MNIAPDATLAALRAEFPGFRIWLEPTSGRHRFVARRQHPGTGLHTVVTSDPAELRAALAAARSEQRPALAGQVTAVPPSPQGRPATDDPDEVRAALRWPS
jgi:hypothetical protein